LNKNNKIFIGVDLGGTKIMTGAIDPEGHVLDTPVKVPTGAGDRAEKIVQRITDSIQKVLDSLGLTINKVAGIGIGSTGPVDRETGQILDCPQLPGMHFFNLREAIQTHFDVPVRLNNDANCLILGECIFGAAADKQNAVGFTLGTGIGCAIVLRKKILNGSTGTAAEIWPSPYASGTIEDYISGAGVARIYQSITGREATSLDIYHQAVAGDPAALQTWESFGRHLAVPIAWAVNLIDPEVVILGGSIATAYPFFSTSLENHLRKWVCTVPAAKTKVVPASLGDKAGFIGAACLMMAE